MHSPEVAYYIFSGPNKSILGKYINHSTCKNDKLPGYNDYTILKSINYQGYLKAENDIPTLLHRLQFVVYKYTNQYFG